MKEIKKPKPGTVFRVRDCYVAHNSRRTGALRGYGTLCDDASNGDYIIVIEDDRSNEYEMGPYADERNFLDFDDCSFLFISKFGKRWRGGKSLLFHCLDEVK